MEILSILAGLKDKVLDAAHYELLRGAYELQSKNIEQLQINNDALKESNGLLKDKVATLHAELNRAKESLSEIEKAIPKKASEYQPQGVAQAILKLFQQTGKTELEEGYLKINLRQSDIAFSAALRELQEHDILWGSSYIGDVDGIHNLTATGEKLILSGV